MKTRQYIFLAFIVMLVVAGCKEEEPELYTGNDNFHFLSETSSVDEGAGTTVTIPIIFTKNSAKAGSAAVSITSTDAVENVDYEVLNTGLTFDFAANQYTDTILIRPIDNQELTGNKELVISFSSASEATGWPGPDALNSTHRLTILDDDCAVPLVGTFTEVTTGGGAGDGAGGVGQSVDPFPWAAILTVTKASCDGDGKYTISDITMGLYPDGYGSSPNPGTFINNGGSLTIIAAESQDVVYGGDEFSGSGGVISDDSFTLNWTNTYGDQGQSTLTRQ